MTSENPYFFDDPSSPARAIEPYDEETPPSVAIIRAIAALEDIDPVNSPTELDIRLSEQTNPEALDRLFIENDGLGDVFVDLCLYSDSRYDVLIRDSGQVVVRKLD